MFKRICALIIFIGKNVWLSGIFSVTENIQCRGIILFVSLSSATPCCSFTFLSHCPTHLQHLFWFCISVSAFLICSKIICFFFYLSVSWVFLEKSLSCSATAAGIMPWQMQLQGKSCLSLRLCRDLSREDRVL